MTFFIPLSQKCISAIDVLNEFVGKSLSWLTLFMVLTTFIIVILRYLFDFNWIALQEAVMYMHAMVFMLGTAYTLKHAGHVRVDIIYQKCSRKTQAWIDSLGALFLLIPVCLFILSTSWSYVCEAWAIQEGSRNSGGIPAVYLLKSCLILMPVLLLLQGFSMFLGNLLIALGLTTDEEA